MKLRDRALQVRGKVCMVETRGPKHSLFLSVFREFNGYTYVIRRGVVSKSAEILRVFVHA